MRIELARAAAYNQLNQFLNRSEITSKSTDVYARDWFLTYEILQNAGKYFQSSTVVQKQAANLLLAVLDVESTSEVFGASDYETQSAIKDLQVELKKLELLENGVNLSSIEFVEIKSGKRNDQLTSILNAIKRLGFDPKSVSSKTLVRDECLKDRKLFTEAGFEHAWKEGNRRNIFQICDKEKYTK